MKIPRTMIEQCGSYEFAMEPMTDDLVAELKPLHAAHWAETEAYRHGLTLNPQYDTYQKLNAVGRFVVFTARHDGVLVGNSMIHLYESVHTSTLAAKEDTLFILSEHRRGRLGLRFTQYVIRRLTEIGAKELTVSAKVGTRSERFFERLGMQFVAREYHTYLGEQSHVLVRHSRS